MPLARGANDVARVRPTDSPEREDTAFSRSAVLCLFDASVARLYSWILNVITGPLQMLYTSIPFHLRYRLIAMLLVFGLASVSRAELRIQDICRLQGQEENTLQGVGLVVGLKGTGDGDLKSTIRTLAQLFNGLGGNASTDPQGRLVEKEFANAKNVAAVLVTARIPPAGATQGDRINCTVSAVQAKSLEGGVLILTNMLGPRADQATTYALASGPITIEDPRLPTTGKIVNGCKMEQSVRNPFVQNNRITLVLDPNHSSFASSQLVADKVNRYDEQGGTGAPAGDGYRNPRPMPKIATALDQTHVVVQIPDIYRERPVEFVSMILNLPLINLANKKRVLISEREGVISIGEEVTIAPLAISYGNLSISPRSSSNPNPGGFVPIQSKENPSQTKLENLVEALKVLNVPTQDIISIIKGIHRQGNLYGELILD
jgi:flagellar P-ring protein precursor FlgI